MIELLALGILGLMAAGLADNLQGPPPAAPFRLQGGYYQIPTVKAGSTLTTQLSRQYASLTCAMRVQEVTGSDGVKRVATDIVAFNSETWQIEAARMIQILPSGDYTIQTLTEDLRLQTGYSSDPAKIQSVQIVFLKPARLADRCDTRQLPATTRAVVNTLISRSGSELAKLATR